MEDVSNDDIEIVTVVINRRYQKPLVLTTAYIPPKANLSIAINHIEKVSHNLPHNSPAWVLCGDFNTDLSSAGINNNSRKLLNFAARNQLIQLINSPTRTTITSQSLIDHIYTNLPYSYTNSGVIKYAISDHDLLFINIKKPTYTIPKESFSCRTLTRYSLELLNYQISLTAWESFDNCMNVDNCWSILHTTYLNALEKIAPFVTMNNVKKRKCWTTSDLMKSIRERDRLKAEADSNGDNNSFIEFKKLKNRIKRTVINAKRDFVLTKLEDFNSNPKRYWRELNNLFKPSEDSGSINISLSNNGIEIPTDNTADFMNEYFSTIGSKLANAITLDNSDYVKSLLDESEHQRNIIISWRPTNIEEVCNLIDSIDLQKSSMIEGINTKLFKDCLLCTAEKIVTLFNRILSEGTFPKEWKIACVIPIFKSGNRKSVSNYRPISLLPLIGKLFEKLLHRRMYHFLNDKNFFSPLQCGFRPSMSTTDSVSTMLNHVYEKLNNKIPTMAVFFDLSKAFDSIDHSLLKKKLHASGFRGSCFKLLNSYLSDRFQYTRVNKYTSDLYPICFGVPQGSTLGPLLFIIFINDLTTRITLPQISLYADDTAFYLSNKDPIQLSNDLTTASNDFQNWCMLNKLTLNQSKCKSMLFCTCPMFMNLSTQMKLSIGDLPIKRVNEFNYLGITLDQFLNFESHLKKIKYKITSRMFTLKKIRWTLKQSDALTLYRSSILPYFDQGALFYSSTNKKTFCSLQTLQNKSLRIIYPRKGWKGTSHAHTTSRLMLIEDRCRFAMLKYAQQRSFTNSNLRKSDTRRLRSDKKKLLKTSKPNCVIYEKSFVHRSSIIWNNLSEEIKLSPSLNAFKTRTKCELKLGNINFPE